MFCSGAGDFGLQDAGLVPGLLPHLARCRRPCLSRARSLPSSGSRDRSAISACRARRAMPFLLRPAVSLLLRADRVFWVYLHSIYEHGLVEPFRDAVRRNGRSRSSIDRVDLVCQHRTKTGQAGAGVTRRLPATSGLRLVRRCAACRSDSRPAPPRTPQPR